MKTYNGLQSKLARLGALILIMGLVVSCGSYQNTSYYDNDRVYNSTPRQQQITQSNADANYYSNYFKQAGEDLQYFTDVDNYTSSTSDSTNHKPLQAIGYGGWGDETDNVSINIYNNGWGYSPYYNSWYGSPYWGISFGFNWGWGGYYSPWYGSSWGYPHYPYYPHYYYPSHRYNNRYVVQNTGQRTGYYNNRVINNSGRSVNQSNRNYNSSNRSIYNSNRRVDPNFNSNRRVNSNTINRENSSNRTNTIRSTRDNNNYSRPNNSSRTYNNSSYNSNRNNTNSTIRTTPSRSNYSSPSPSRGGNYGGSSRTSSGRSGGGRR